MSYVALKDAVATWLGEDFINRKSIPNSTEDCAVFYAGLSAPLSNSQSFAHVSKFMVISFIIGLLSRRSPLAVFRTIVAIIVNALDSMSFTRLFSHVGKKVFKRIEPTLTYGYTSFMVQMRHCMIFVITPFFHSSKAIIFSRVRHVVCGQTFTRYITPKTPTRLRIIERQVTTTVKCFSATFTQAVPHSSIASIFSSRDYSKSVEFFTSKVDELHNILHKTLLHVRGLCQPAWKQAFGYPLGTGAL